MKNQAIYRMLCLILLVFLIVVVSGCHADTDRPRTEASETAAEPPGEANMDDRTEPGTEPEQPAEHEDSEPEKNTEPETSDPEITTEELLDPEFITGPYRLVIDGAEVDSPFPYVGYDKEMDQFYVKLPMLMILEKLGAAITYEETEKIRIDINDEAFLLDTSELTLINLHSTNGVDLLIAAPGGTAKGGCEYIDEERELVAGDGQLQLLFQMIGVQMRVDLQERVIQIERIKE